MPSSHLRGRRGSSPGQAPVRRNPRAGPARPAEPATPSPPRPAAPGKPLNLLKWHLGAAQPGAERKGLGLFCSTLLPRGKAEAPRRRARPRQRAPLGAGGEGSRLPAPRPDRPREPSQLPPRSEALARTGTALVHLNRLASQKRNADGRRASPDPTRSAAPQTRMKGTALIPIHLIFHTVRVHFI